MVDPTKGSRRGTRHKFSKRARDRGKVSITKILQTFKIGDKVRIRQEPAIHGGMPHHRFKNLIGTILERRGNAYLLKIKDMNKSKEVIANPVHLERL